MLDLGLKIKSIDIDINTLSEIYNIDGNCQVEDLKQLKDNAMKIRMLLSEIEVPALTKLMINDKVVFKNLLVSIVNDNRFILKKADNRVYVRSKYVTELLKLKNIDSRSFYSFFKSEDIIKKNSTTCRIGKDVYRCIVVNIELLNELDVN